jgi:diadenylate cyclase
MQQALQSIIDQIRLTTLVDIGITSVLIYWLFSLIRGTRAVRLVIGVGILFVVYAAARFFNLPLLRQILETGAIVGVFALVVVFQPELRRALERIGRVGSMAWLFSPADERGVEHVAVEIARAAAILAADGHGALIVIERETGLEEIAESGVMTHADLSVDLLLTIFMPRTALHDGAVIIRGEQVVAAGALLPLAETTVHSERLGTRHRAALGIAEQTDAVVIVVSEESSQISLVERARIVRNLDEAQLARAIVQLLRPGGGRSLVERGTGAMLSATRPTRRQVAGLRRAARRSVGAIVATPGTPPTPPITPAGDDSGVEATVVVAPAPPGDARAPDSPAVRPDRHQVEPQDSQAPRADRAADPRTAPSASARR